MKMKYNTNSEIMLRMTNGWKLPLVKHFCNIIYKWKSFSSKVWRQKQRLGACGHTCYLFGLGSAEWAAEGLSKTGNCQLSESKEQEVIFSSLFSRLWKWMAMNLWIKPLMKQWTKEINKPPKEKCLVCMCYWEHVATLTIATFGCDVFTQDRITLTSQNN